MVWSVLSELPVMVKSVWKGLGEMAMARFVVIGLVVLAISLLTGLGEMARSVRREDVAEY